jgi:hypothetical protein
VLAVVVCVAKILNILGEVAKEEDVVLANLAGDFDLISSVCLSNRVYVPGSR